MFQQDEDGEMSAVVEDPSLDTSLTYDELVKDLIQEEKAYIRELNMIIKVCRPLSGVMAFFFADGWM